MRQPHFSIFGFPVRVETSALFLLGIGALMIGDAILYIAVILFGSVLLHELGHAVMFRHYGCASFISIHAFGGSTTSHGGAGLTNRQHVMVSLAGPFAQLFLLGIPGGIILYSKMDEFYILGFGSGIFLLTLVWINVAMPLFNLLPIYPLDGGQILLHLLSMTRLRDPWKLTQRITIAIGAIAAYGLYWAGFTMGAVFIGYMIFQNIQTRGGQRPGLGGQAGLRPSPIRNAVADANQTRPVRQSAEAAFAEAYERMLDGNSYRLSALRETLEPSHPNDMATLDAWQRALDGNHDEVDRSHSPLLKASLAVVLGRDPEGAQLAPTICQYLASPEITAALSLLTNNDKIAEGLRGLDDASLEQLREHMLSAGLPTEQMAVARAIRLRAEAAATSNPAPPTEPPAFP